MAQRTTYLYAAAIAAVLLAACGGGRKAADAPARFRLPDVPSTLVAPEARAAYLSAHYWDLYDFADTALVHNPAVTEQAFADYLQVLGVATPAEAARSVEILMDKAFSADSAVFAHFAGLAEKYLYDPNSPMRDEELYIPVLQYIDASDRIGDLHKLRPRDQLSMALRNRPGDIAADFTYTTARGRKARMHEVKGEYTLLFFNNPDCEDCRRIKEILIQWPAVGRAVTVLAVYPDADLGAWRKTEYPAEWINGYDEGETIRNQRLYDLKAIPCLYLLDRDKRVILKDARIEEVVQYGPLAGTSGQ